MICNSVFLKYGTSSRPYLKSVISFMIAIFHSSLAGRLTYFNFEMLPTHKFSTFVFPVKIMSFRRLDPVVDLQSFFTMLNRFLSKDFELNFRLSVNLMNLL